MSDGSYKANKTAILFYESIGYVFLPGSGVWLTVFATSFVLDPSSPGYGASLPVDDGNDEWEDEGRGFVDEECDYMIMARYAAPGIH